MQEVHFPSKPGIFQGYTSNSKFGFRFNSEAAYHNKDLVHELLATLFVSDYASENRLKRINTLEDLKSAVNGCTDVDKIDTVYKKNVSKFLDVACECKHYIVDSSQGSESLGNTLGEMSLAYFKYLVDT